MQNFSPLGNLINAFLKQQASRAASNIVVGGNNMLNALQNATQKAPQQQINHSAFKQTNFNTKFEMAQMENTERAVLVKELLNLPKDFQTLLATMQNANKLGAQNSAKLFATMQNIDVAQLMQMMQTNGKEALSKLMQLTSMLNKTGNVDTKQLQELQFVINACMPNPNMSNVQFMKNLILLYLPWLPIGENNNFDIDFSSSEESSDSGSESDDTITILIQTENYGNVKALLVLEAVNKVNVIINCAKIFPKDLLLARLNENSKEYKLETQMTVNEQQTVEKSELDKTKKVHMSGSSVVNPYVLLMAHAIIRNVIDIDKNQSLVKVRKQNVQK